MGWWWTVGFRRGKDGSAWNGWVHKSISSVGEEWLSIGEER
jgi:hypothetical protein